MNLVQTARICHLANMALCEAYGDYSQLEWEDVSDDIKNSAIVGVMYHLTTENSSPAASHNNWMKFKLAEGWTYGEVKCEDSKTHPCLIQYVDLPPEQKAKDFIFKAIVEAIHTTTDEV